MGSTKSPPSRARVQEGPLSLPLPVGGGYLPSLLIRRSPNGLQDRSESFAMLVDGALAVQIRPARLVIVCPCGSQGGSRKMGRTSAGPAVSEVYLRCSWRVTNDR